MMKVRFFLLVAVVLVVLTGCDRDAKVLLEQAEAYLPAEVDSAEKCLNSIEQPGRLGDAPRALYGLLRTHVDDRQGRGVGSDSLIRDSYEYYRDASHAGQTADKTLMRHYAQSCYYMALFYSSCDSTKRCEELLHQAVKYSEKCEDWHTCYLAYTQLGNSTIWSNPEYAIQQSLKALEIYHKINDDVNNEVLLLGEIAAKYLSSAQPDSAMMYFNMGERLAAKSHLEKSQNAMRMGLASTFRYMGEYEKALDYAKKGITTAEGEVFVSSQLSLAECYYESDSLDQAKAVLNTIPCDSNDYLGKYLILRNLSEIAIMRKDYDSIYAYVDSAYECLENRFFHAQQVKDEYYQANLAKELEKEQVQHEKKMSWWIGGAIILFLLLIAAFIIYNVWKNKQRLVAEHQKEMQHKLDIIHQKSITLAVLQQRSLKKLENYQKYLADDENARMSKELWADIEQYIDEADNGFVEKLRKQRKDFKEEDIQLCMLVRMKMTNATIAKIFYISESAVKKRKAALKKTGFQIADANITLEQIIENL